MSDDQTRVLSNGDGKLDRIIEMLRQPSLRSVKKLQSYAPRATHGRPGPTDHNGQAYAGLQ